MSLILQELSKDLDLVQRSLGSISTLDEFGQCTDAQLDKVQDSALNDKIKQLRSTYVATKIDQSIMRGSLLLYLTGRFESFVKSLLQETCERYVKAAGSFEKLPKSLKENLIVYTGMVIQSPKKFGHAENGVKAFVTTLSSNLNGMAPFDKINTECIAVTDTNMRPNIIKELFNRIGADKILEKVSQQAALLAFFKTQSSDEAMKAMYANLNNLVDLRNTIAHPIPSITWPSEDEIRANITFISTLAKALSDVCDIYVASLQTSP